MKDQLAIQKLLHQKLDELKLKNPSFSLNAFSRRVGVAAGPLSAIMNGKRRVSRKLANRMIGRLMLDPQERSEILRLFPEKRPYKKQNDTHLIAIHPEYLAISAAHYRTISEWQHFAILSLMDTKGFKPQANWISQRLGISVTCAQESVDRLIKIGILKLSAEGALSKTSAAVRTSDDIADMSLRKSHDSTLDLARTSLHRDSLSIRDFTAVTVAIDPQRMSMAKEFIRKFQDEFCTLVEQGNQTEVYKLSMQFFPLTVMKGIQNDKI